MNPLLMPLAAIQGRRVRSEMEVLPEATGPTTGQTAGSDDSDLQLLVVGNRPQQVAARAHMMKHSPEHLRVNSGRSTISR